MPVMRDSRGVFDGFNKESAMYKVEVTGREGFLFKVNSNGYQFDFGPKGRGVSPSAAFLASLAGCIGIYIRKYAEGVKLPINEFCVNAEAELCRESPMRFENIKISIDLKGVRLEDRRKEALLRFIKNCPVHNTLKYPPVMEARVL